MFSRSFKRVCHARRWIAIAAFGGMAVATPAQRDVVVFDEDDPLGHGHYDASFGLARPPSRLALAGSGGNKLTFTNRAENGESAGWLAWTSNPAGHWELFVASPGWEERRVDPRGALILELDGPEAMPAGALPRIGIESGGKVKSGLVDLGDQLASGLDAAPGRWQSVRIPLAAFEAPRGFSWDRVQSVRFVQGADDGADRELWFDRVRFEAADPPPIERRPERPSGLSARAGDRSVTLHWDEDGRAGPPVRYEVLRATSSAGPFETITPAPVSSRAYADVEVKNGVAYWHRVRAVSSGGLESPDSEAIRTTPRAFANDDEFLDYLQEAAFDYFWLEANPENGLIRDRSRPYAPCSVAAVGFGLTGIGIGIDRGWIDRDRGRRRTLTTLKTFWEGPQGEEETGRTGHRGWFYHFLKMDDAVRAGTSELSSIDTALFLAGALYAREYFDGDHPDERRIRELAGRIFDRVDWRWMTRGTDQLSMGWGPETGFLSHNWNGYNEAMILCLLAMGAERGAAPPSIWTDWTETYDWGARFGLEFVAFPPLFGHQYSHCWIDFRGIADAYMRGKGITYFENSRRATLAQRRYCVANPGGFKGYGPTMWGLTACDGPGSLGFHGYTARGALPAQNDDGTLAPTAVGGSIAFAPEHCVPTLRNFYDRFRTKLWTGYGFSDAFNLEADWWGPDVIGIDQGAILLMLENHRTGRVWDVFMRRPEIRLGLEKAGFRGVNGFGREGRTPQ